MPHERCEEIALLHQKIDAMEAAQKQLWTLVWGNGKPGIRDDVHEIKAWMRSTRRWMHLIAATVLIELIGAALVFLWAVIQHVGIAK